MTDKVQKIREEVERVKTVHSSVSLKDSKPDILVVQLCINLLSFIDSLQEEPVSEDLEEAAYKFVMDNFGNPKEPLYKFDQRCFKAGAKWQKEKDSILPKVWNRENLDDFSYQTAYDLSNDWAKETPTWHDVEMACKLGAQWQKQQDQSIIELAEDHAMLAGMEKMKEQMMKDAEDLVVGIDANGLACVNVDGVLPDDTVRVLVIKED